MDKDLKDNIRIAPSSPGVYEFLDKTGEVIYVGKAISLVSRLKSYINTTDPKTKAMTDQAQKLIITKVFSEFEALVLEAALIKKFRPKYNLRLKDDKSFLYIAITQEKYPKVFAARKNDVLSPKFLFGPFPSASTVREVLKFLRRIFPYCSQKESRKPCFWSHIGLCNPCPGEIEQLPPEEAKTLRSVYLKNIRNLSSVLKGNSKKLVDTLNKEMENASKNQEYELATTFRNQISSLNYLTTKRMSVSSYLENPNFFEETRINELTKLAEILNISDLSRIECYDISNILGQFATGSMVVFENGIANKNEYRKFKIKISGKPNDVGMMTEVLNRRFNHKEWSFPDLIIVDGGKAQIGATVDVLNKREIKIPIIGLAKRLETIVIPNLKPIELSLGFSEVNLKNDSPALNLLKRIRDEAHRFAITYHRQLRKESYL